MKKAILKFLLSKRSTELPKSDFHRLMTMAYNVKGLISLGPGEPDFATPKHILNYGKKMLDQGFTHYSPPQGRQELLEAIAKKVKKRDKLKNVGTENVIATVGSTEGLMLALSALTDVTEEIVIPDPGFLAYQPMVEFLNGDPVPYKLDEDTGFQIDTAALKKLVSVKTRAMIMCTPSNPTGTVLKKSVLEEIADVAREYNIMILSDEAYENCYFGKSKHLSIGALNGMEEYVATFYSFSKTFAMPGFRLGYVVAPEWMISKITQMHIYTTLSPPTISQKMGAYALEKGWKDSDRMKKEYARRNKLVTKRIDQMDGLTMKVKPEGAFYAFPKIDFNMSSAEFVERMINEAKVLTIPGNEFGKGGEGFVRMSYATSYKKIETAMDRMEKVLKKMKK